MGILQIKKVGKDIPATRNSMTEVWCSQSMECVELCSVNETKGASFEDLSARLSFCRSNWRLQKSIYQWVLDASAVKDKEERNKTENL